MKLYNTLTRTMEELRPLHNKRLRMFVCGPTVYDYSHIGHARTYLAYDIIARYLRSRGYNLFYIVNITDIDDKIINRANESGEDPLALADRFTREFFRDMQALGIASVNLYVKASDHVPEIIAQVSALIEKGYAYRVNGDVYYDVTRFPSYGKLSGQKMEQLTVHRVDPDPRKRNPVDFVLWKSQKPGEPAWDSPWGQGRPGWHIEDTAITTTYFGPTYDLHGGGQDLIFPHHEAEIAQAEAATGVRPLVRYWLHAGLLMVTGARMGKSMGNFITIKEALKRHEAEALRLYYAMSHYRSQLEFDESNIAQAEQVLDKLRSVWNQFRAKIQSSLPNGDLSLENGIERIASNAMSSFIQAMDDDFNTPRALAVVVGYAKEIEPFASQNLGEQSVRRILNVFDFFGDVFGILQPAPPRETKAFDEIMKILLEMREDARRRKDWSTADRIRDQLSAIGIGLEDTATGVRWYFASSRVTQGLG